MLITNATKRSLSSGHCTCWLADSVSKGNIGDLPWMQTTPNSKHVTENRNAVSENITGSSKPIPPWVVNVYSARSGKMRINVYRLHCIEPHVPAKIRASHKCQVMPEKGCETRVRGIPCVPTSETKALLATGNCRKKVAPILNSIEQGQEAFQRHNDALRSVHAVLEVGLAPHRSCKT